MMENFTAAIGTFFDSSSVAEIVRALILLVVGFVSSRLVDRSVSRLLKDRLAPHGIQLLRRSAAYLVLALFVTMALHQVGFHIGGLLGAAGILTVALGFASQTAASNLVSGLFLLVEGSFAVGHVIRVGATTGEVLSIDLLSTALRTFDNLAVRIPNETLMKSEITNLSRFPIRRYDLQIGIAYKEDLRRVQSILEKVAEHNRFCLAEPRPITILQGFGESSLDIQFSVWGLSSDYLDLRNSMHQDVKAAFDREGVEIPFPHRSLYAGSATDPLPVTIVEGDDRAPHPPRSAGA